MKSEVIFINETSLLSKGLDKEKVLVKDLEYRVYDFIDGKRKYDNVFRLEN